MNEFILFGTTHIITLISIFTISFGFAFYVLRELINKFTLTFDISFVYSYIIIFIIPFMIGLYKVIQIEND